MRLDVGDSEGDNDSGEVVREMLSEVLRGTVRALEMYVEGENEMRR